MGCDVCHRAKVRWTAPGWALLSLFVCFPARLAADVIVLKNGMQIIGDVTREDDQQVFYVSGGGEYTVPKASVQRIEKWGPPAAPPQQPARPSRNVPLPIKPPVGNAAEAGSAAIRDGEVDEAYLRQLADDADRKPTPENRRKLRLGFETAAIFLVHRGDPEAGIAKYREAVKYLPHDEFLTLGLGYLLWKQEHYLEAVDLLLPEADRHPESPNYCALLGSSYYGMENLDQAIFEWNKALEIQDSKPLRDAVARAEHEREVSGGYSESRTSHFLLRYDGRRNEKLSIDISRQLESAFQDLVLDLDYAPTETIVVLVYPKQDFRDITSAPDWAGALYDGKIRLPVSGLTQMTPDLSRMLKHELTHSFVRQVTQGRCPTWFNEGLAQLEEGASTARWGSGLAKALVAGKTPPYASLEGSFMGLPGDLALVAYAKSLAALEYVRDTLGMGEIPRMLRQMATSDFSVVLLNEARLSYAGLDTEVAAYLVKKYGS